MSEDNTQLDQLIFQVHSGAKYQQITPNLVRRLCQSALSAGLVGKPAVKFVRNKLHQVGGAYFRSKVDYKAAINDLELLPSNIHSADTQGFSRQIMELHASTAERLPIIESFFHTCLESIAPINSISDLACGLNPFTLPWMPLAEDVHYFACDIYHDMLEFINAFFKHCNINGKASSCDLIAKVPAQKTQVAFLLKSLPCLEQMDKFAADRLLESIPSEHILVSFPVHSLRGRQKGMPSFYKEHFLKLVNQKPWLVQEYHFKSELAFLVSK